MLFALPTYPKFVRSANLFRLCGFSVLLLFGLLTACQQPEPDAADRQTANASPAQTRFHLMEAQATGITFVNQVKDRRDFNILTFRNYYNGGGVAIGDVNNDGLPDIYLTANLAGNKLYLNKGNLQFEDITEQAGVAGAKAWSTGVTMADVNGDGWLDIYVCNSGDVDGDNKENELFINNQDGTFTERAAAYGLNNQGYSTQAAFFDYDLDGDLDCYLLNNSFKDPSRIELFRSMRDTPDELGGDKLYRNDGPVGEAVRFTDVTQAAGIYSSVIGFGLGAVIGDINHDFYPDIYISNDFWERDYLYINRQDGTFSEELIDRIDFCSISSMGGDMGDLNNDGHPEIVSTDMLAADNYRLKAMSAFDPYHLENMKYRANYHYQIGQNCLHFNEGGTGRFQEVGMLSGVAATDWSWGALIFDFENDGNKDLFVSNGIQKDLMYMDFRDFLANNDVYRKIASGEPLDFPALVRQMPFTPLANYAFANRGNMQFENQAEELGLAQPSFSNGAAYGDLDNDGDLDLVVNNVNMYAFVYRNEAEQTKHHHLKIRFKGPAGNPFGIGALVRLETAAGLQTMQNFNTRGFQSSIEPHLLFGLGRQERVERLEIVWPDRRRQVLTDIAADQTLVLDHSEADGRASPPSLPEPAFADVSDQYLAGEAQHRENRYNDFDHEILLWRMLSTEGPRLITGDVNGDGRTDFVLPGAHDDEDKLFLQTEDGTFRRRPVPAFRQTKGYETTCGAFFDFDKDGDLDLMLGAGGNEYQRGGEAFGLRYFENDGQGNFRLDPSAAPPIVGNFSCLEAADVDKDGDVDLFLGGRCVPGNYGLPPRSFLLINDQRRWRDATPEALAGAGMVTDAAWADTDGDQDMDLVLVGDWMGVQVFRNDLGQLVAADPLPDSEGWWTRIEAGDLDGDGDPDFVLGNWGLNSKFKASSERPLTLYVNDFDQNGKSEFILNWYAPLDERDYPFATKMELTQQLPSLRKENLKYEDYAHKTYEKLLPPEVREQSIAYQANYLESALLWNDKGRLTLEALPWQAQVAPVFGIAIGDLTGDGQADIWLGGNFYGLKPQAGRHDAGRGLLLAGRGDRRFEALAPTETGLHAEGEVRDAAVLTAGDKRLLLVARNNERPLIFEKIKALQ